VAVRIYSVKSSAVLRGRVSTTW